MKRFSCFLVLLVSGCMSVESPLTPAFLTWWRHLATWSGRQAKEAPAKTAHLSVSSKAPSKAPSPAQGIESGEVSAPTLSGSSSTQRLTAAATLTTEDEEQERLDLEGEQRAYFADSVQGRSGPPWPFRRGFSQG